eukprot:PhF_6_TR43673/c0_g1_i1/m.67115
MGKKCQSCGGTTDNPAFKFCAACSARSKKQKQQSEQQQSESPPSSSSHLVHEEKYCCIPSCGAPVSNPVHRYCPSCHKERKYLTAATLKMGTAPTLPDILDEIISCLDVKDWGCVFRTCSLWHQFIEDILGAKVVTLQAKRIQSSDGNVVPLVTIGPSNVALFRSLHKTEAACRVSRIKLNRPKPYGAQSKVIYRTDAEKFCGTIVPSDKPCWIILGRNCLNVFVGVIHTPIPAARKSPVEFRFLTSPKHELHMLYNTFEGLLLKVALVPGVGRSAGKLQVHYGIDVVEDINVQITPPYSLMIASSWNSGCDDKNVDTFDWVY